jgi:glycosyltransferase involved in cell wall biosynthesis
MGIDEPCPGDPDPDGWAALRQKLAGKRVLTYVGRVENGKGCDELVELFLRFAEEEKAPDLMLLLLGKRTLPLPPHAQICSPGFVSEFVKYLALAATTVAVAPSPYESLCIAALESWMHRKPLLANGRCPVLAGHCVRSNGGLWYSNYAEFRETLRLLLGDPSLRQTLGAQGRTYVETRYRWPAIEEVWRTAIEKVATRSTS